MKKILICLSLIYFENIQACSFVGVDPMTEHNDAVMANPENAVVALTGVIISEKRNPGDFLKGSIQFIKPERKWTNIQSTKIDTTSICGRGQMTGEKYLLLSNIAEAKDFYFLVELSKAEDYITKLAQKKNFIGNINPAWQYCKKDEECTIVKDECKSDLSVNLEYKNIYLNFLKTRSNLKCSSEPVKLKPSNKCVNYFCS